MPSNHLILCRPLFLLPSIFPSSRGFSSESVLLIRWPKYWSFSFNISPSNEYSGLISFRMDWLDLLAVQGTLKSLPQHHSSKTSILWHSAFFIVQLSNPYMTTGKAIALTRWTFVGKVMSLLFKTLSRLVIAFRSMIHQINNCIWCGDKIQNSFFPHTDIQLSPKQLVQKVFSLCWIALVPLSKINLLYKFESISGLSWCQCQMLLVTITL